MTYAATTGETSAPAKDQYRVSTLTPGAAPAIAPMKSNADHTSITAGSSEAIRAVREVAPRAHVRSRSGHVGGLAAQRSSSCPNEP